MENIIAKVNLWLHESFDEATRKRVQYLIDNDEKELTECFYRDLEFGTGGLRGTMDVGTNRVNIYTIGMATQGLSNYLKQNFAGKEVKVAIAHDSRNNSRLFAETAAEIFTANGFKAYLFESLRPTPELSFAIRELKCQAGIVVTASHNPKEYNGYKVYWEDGAQIVAPHDKNIIAEVRKITSPLQVLFRGKKENIELLGDAFDQKYLNRILGLSISKEAIAKASDLKIVYTPIHGTGVKLVPALLRKFGFKNIINVPEQDVVDGNFPTVKSPNPENAEALSMAIAKAKVHKADLVLATDPDADRVGIAVPDANGEFVLLNGNQTGALLVYYMLNAWKDAGKLNGKQYIVKTIVTTELLVEMAKKFGVEYYDVLTGFKYIAEILGQNEGKKDFIIGGEESYGYLAGDFIRDKDAVMSGALIAEMLAWAKSKNTSALDLLAKIYVEYGFYYEGLVNVEKHGMQGASEIKQMMTDFRNNPPKKMDGFEVVKIKDYDVQKEFDLVAKTEKPINLPKSDVLQFVAADGTQISVRPSGTEPKIKFYFGVKLPMANTTEFNAKIDEAKAKIKRIAGELNL